MTEDVVVVEGEDTAREVHETYLESKGYNVTTYENPKEALEHYDGESLVITEYGFLGDFNGLDIVEALNGETEVIIHTTFEQETIEEKTGKRLDNLDSSYLRKSDYNELLELVEDLTK